MAAGYELTQTRPLDADYKKVDEHVREVLKYIFDHEEGFPHDITKVRELHLSQAFCSLLTLPCTSCMIIMEIIKFLQISSHDFFSGESLPELNGFVTKQVWHMSCYCQLGNN